MQKADSESFSTHISGSYLYCFGTRAEGARGGVLLLFSVVPLSVVLRAERGAAVRALEAGGGVGSGATVELRNLRFFAGGGRES